MSLGPGQIVHGWEEGPDCLGNCELPLNAAISFNPGSVVDEVSLKSLQVLKDLQLAIDGILIALFAGFL